MCRSTPPAFYDDLFPDNDYRSVGEVPFTVHTLQSDFKNSDLLVSQFNGSSCGTQRAISIDFYGPVKILPIGNGDLPPLRVDYIANLGGGDIRRATVSRRMDFAIHPTIHNRVLITPKPGIVFPAGEYRVSTWTNTADQRVVCDELLTTATVPVRPMVVDSDSEYSV